MIVDKHHFLTPQGGLCVLDIHSSAFFSLKIFTIFTFKVQCTERIKRWVIPIIS